MEPLAVVATPDGGAELSVRAQPRARRPGLAGVSAGRLRVRVAAPPEDGRANEELLAILAEALGLRPSAVALVAGERSREKRVRVALAPELVRARLAERLA